MIFYIIIFLTFISLIISTNREIMYATRLFIRSLSIFFERIISSRVPCIPVCVYFTPAQLENISHPLAADLMFTPDRGFP